MQSNEQFFQIWKQTSNPFLTKSHTVNGYEAVKVSYTVQDWGGIRWNGETNKSILEGSSHTQNWFYAVGSYAAWNNGIPGPTSTGVVSKVEFYASKQGLSHNYFHYQDTLYRKIGICDFVS